MNKITKPISSPGRTTEKFPPPLMRFLRSNVGNKSRRRSRASPMFLRKKNTPFETSHEPSSPKVTCIGQVRVRRSNKATVTTPHRRNRKRNRLCRCLRNLKPKSCRSVWNKWVSFFRCDGGCRNSEDSHVSSSPAIEELQEREQKSVDCVSQGLISRTPPKNAFLLTRCRSAPYRSSSLASIFRESTSSEEEEVGEKIKNLKICENEKVEEEEEGTCNESDGCEESKAAPLILSRCKSEPARTWDRLPLV